MKFIIKKSCDSKNILGCVLASEDRNIWDGSKWTKGTLKNRKEKKIVEKSFLVFPSAKWFHMQIRV